MPVYFKPRPVGNGGEGGACDCEPSVVVVQNVSDFELMGPGDANKIYKCEENDNLYVWDVDEQRYIRDNQKIDAGTFN